MDKFEFRFRYLHGHSQYITVKNAFRHRVVYEESIVVIVCICSAVSKLLTDDDRAKLGFPVSFDLGEPVDDANSDQIRYIVGDPDRD